MTFYDIEVSDKYMHILQILFDFHHLYKTLNTWILIFIMLSW